MSSLITKEKILYTKSLLAMQSEFFYHNPKKRKSLTLVIDYEIQYSRKKILVYMSIWWDMKDVIYYEGATTFKQLMLSIINNLFV